MNPFTRLRVHPYDHRQATQLTAVEKYLLDELTPELRDEFEEHFFDCQECATDLGATVAFMEAAKREFRLNPVPKPAVAPKGKSGLAVLRPVIAWSALAASLLVIAYQNVLVYPRFKAEIADSRSNSSSSRAPKRRPCLYPAI